MTLQKALTDFLAMYRPILHELKEYKANEYKQGVAEGLEMALEAIEVILEEYSE